MTMSKKTENALLGLMLAVMFLVGGTADNLLPQHPHVCADIEHKTCDGECECDGFECPKN